MNISLKISDKNTEKTINLGELCKLLGINEAELQGLSLNIEKHGANLKAAVNLDDNYPGLSIDGETQDEIYYLATVELPNNDYPWLTRRDSTPAGRKPKPIVPSLWF